jgi:hypothetical protein
MLDVSLFRQTIHTGYYSQVSVERISYDNGAVTGSRGAHTLHTILEQTLLSFVRHDRRCF